jgi:hypothetical protein
MIVVLQQLVWLGMQQQIKSKLLLLIQMPLVFMKHKPFMSHVLHLTQKIIHTNGPYILLLVYFCGVLLLTIFFGFCRLITFVHDSPVNLTATYGESPCTAEASTGVQADVWMVVEEIRPRSITNLAEMESIAPSATTQLVTGLSGFSTYAFTISAFNVLGYSVSSLKLVTTTAIIQAPNVIGVAPSLNTPSAVQLTEEWGDHPRNGGYTITGYYISCQHNTSVDISHVEEVVAFHQELSIVISDDSSATGNERAKIATIDGEAGSDGDIDHANLTSLVATDGKKKDLVSFFID